VVEAGIDSVEHGTFIDDYAAQLMGRQGTYLVPTMSTWDYRLRHAAQWGLPKEEVERAEGRRDASRASFRRCLAAGVRIAAGTDAGGSAVRHGTIVRELELMVDGGMTPMQAITAATHTAAELFGSLDHVGTIEVGKVADLILVDGDPLAEIGALRNIWAIYQGGRRIR
jgi:imidazolonepropionase-like amidohydrolase